MKRAVAQDRFGSRHFFRACRHFFREMRDMVRLTRPTETPKKTTSVFDQGKHSGFFKKRKAAPVLSASHRAFLEKSGDSRVLFCAIAHFVDFLPFSAVIRCGR